MADKRDKVLKQLIREAGPEDPGSDFTPAIMDMIRGAEHADPVRQVLNQDASQNVPANFTRDVMAAVTAMNERRLSAAQFRRKLFRLAGVLFVIMLYAIAMSPAADPSSRLVAGMANLGRTISELVTSIYHISSQSVIALTVLVALGVIDRFIGMVHMSLRARQSRSL